MEGERGKKKRERLVVAKKGIEKRRKKGREVELARWMGYADFG